MFLQNISMKVFYVTVEFYIFTIENSEYGKKQKEENKLFVVMP